MRRLPAIVLLAALVLAGCSGDDDDDAAADVVVDRTREIPADVQAFLDRVVDPTTIELTADYTVLNKNGGGEHVAHVVSSGGALTLTIDGDAVDLADEPLLAQYGIFSGFLAANPKAAIEATARRDDAGDAVTSTRDAAGETLDCLAIPVQGSVVSTWCLLDIGVFGYVDIPSVRYEVTTIG